MFTTNTATTNTAASIDDRERGVDLRLSCYTDGRDALSLTEDLIHLETQARVPMDLDLGWLASSMSRPGFALVVGSIGWRLAGFVAGNIGDDLLLSRLAVSAAALEECPALPDVLIETMLTHANRPWVDVVVPRGFVALPSLLRRGWEVVTDAGDPSTVRLTGAYVDGIS
ncbi:MAG: hypothetical protein Q4G43_10490 [Mobilicoccus sp.]|nr:hypothetical protein [Mobilicoccus sp.]